MKPFLCVTVLLLSAVCASAAPETQAPPSPSAAPKAAMDRLEPLVGDWQLTVEITVDNGATWQPMSTSPVRIEWRQKGLMLAEIPLDTDGQGFHMETYLTYDQYRKVYRKAAIDDVWGVMDIYSGQVEDAALVMTNLASGTLFPIDESTLRAFRLTLPLDQGDHRVMQIEKSDDAGATWQPAFRSSYRRITR
ncbi:DUF1579 family protein [Aestuariibacter halophilus]|uniref:DUF1579 family protein n=1 Tax=Fluctibacter halophilus TaxID=226011 RepID=A0ABS8G7Y0_9ALTE|nr:DUF1579 family protein [Aestuariibacter halophilus]MCC2616533.1 DUF1579 family protein [Aestuariibacter halophilus]